MRLIAGPCQHESYEKSFDICKQLYYMCKDFNIDFVFKASFDKANRTSMSGIRGLGIHQTLQDFGAIKSMFPSVKFLTDVHEIWQVNTIAADYDDIIDVLQIPAFLCRQTDLIREAVETKKIVNIKKGQFLAPWDVRGIWSKTQDAKEVWITERGTSFGYNTLVNDFTGVKYMLDTFPDVAVVFDATHSVQKPGGNGTSSGGNRSYVPTIAKAAAAVGVRNFFMETHPSPDDAPSDGPNMVKLSDMRDVLYSIKRIVDLDG